MTSSSIFDRAARMRRSCWFPLLMRWRTTRSSRVHPFWRHARLCLLIWLLACLFNTARPMVHASPATPHSTHVASESSGTSSPTSALTRSRHDEWTTAALTRWSHPEWGTVALNSYVSAYPSLLSIYGAVSQYYSWIWSDTSNENAFSAPVTGTVPLYFCLFNWENSVQYPTVFAYSLQSNCSAVAQTFSSPLSRIVLVGYVYPPTSNPSGIPVKPLYDCPRTSGAHSYSASTSDCPVTPTLLAYGLTVSSIANYWVTTGNPASVAPYSFQQTLGYLSTTQQPGMVALYGCTIPSNATHFVSFRTDCEGIGVGDSSVSGLPFLLGYLYQNQPANTIATQIYRCHWGTGDSVSTDSTCGGQRVDGPVGFLLPTSDTLSYLVTTGNAGAVPGYSQESTLGYLLQTQQTGTVPLYGCLVPNSTIHFVSFSSTCEGAGVGDSSVSGLPFLLGYVYSSAPAGTITRALYRCHFVTGSGAIFFESLDPNCEGQSFDGPLGSLLPSADTVSYLVSTGNPAAVADLTYEGTLGYLLQNQLAGTVPLYGCVVGGTNIHFVSFSGTCEGAGVGDSSIASLPFLLGYVYSSPPSEFSTTALYRCHLVTGSGFIFFESVDPNCEGQSLDGPLGYVLPATTTVYACGSSRMMLQSDADAIVSQAENSGSFTTDQINQLKADPCLILDQQAGDTSTLANQAFTVESDGHVCMTYYWAFDHYVLLVPDVSFTMKQQICVDPERLFLDDGTTPPRSKGMTTQAYINSAHKPNLPTVQITTLHRIRILSYKLNGDGGNGVLSADWQPYSNGSKGSIRGGWQTVIGYNAGILGAGGGGFFAAFANDYQQLSPVITIDTIPLACVIENNCHHGT